MHESLKSVQEKKSPYVQIETWNNWKFCTFLTISGMAGNEAKANYE